MSSRPLPHLLQDLCALPRETEWVEFKHNNARPDEIGENLSAISNAAALHGRSTGYIAWGVQSDTHAVVGTAFRPKAAKVGNEELENWLLRLLDPRIDINFHEFTVGSAPVVLLEVQPARTSPTRFRGEAFIRVGSYTKKLKDFPEKERKLWLLLSTAGKDWSAEIVPHATLQDLDPQAVSFARAQYREKHPTRAEELASWDDTTFLNKARVTIAGHLTHTAILLLGKEESAHFLSPAQARITWILRDEKNQEKDYQHFDPPFLLASTRVLNKIRNLKVRHLPSGTLFPQELSQYDEWVLREILHNCIAHQDYPLGGRTNVVEAADALLFANAGSFIPGSVEAMIQSDAPPQAYRNPFLAQAMVNLNMIDTIGSGIKRIFLRQRERSFPMPDYDLSDSKRVAVRISGQILDENYTRLLLRMTDLDLMDVIALDKVQKKRPLEEPALKRLRAQKLIEGRRPSLFVSAKVAAATGEKADYIKNRALDQEHYKAMVTRYLAEFGPSKRRDLDKFLRNKISDALSEDQKTNRIRNLLQEMRRDAQVSCQGHGPAAIWELAKTRSMPQD